MTDLEKRFEKQIVDARFNFLEVKGFQHTPKLALLAGMAMGYKMAFQDFGEKIKKLTEVSHGEK